METNIYHLGFRVLGLRDPGLGMETQMEKEMETEVYVIEVYGVLSFRDVGCTYWSFRGKGAMDP